MCVWACLSSNLCPQFLSRAVAVQTSAPGSQLDSGSMWEVSRMKYDLNAHAEVGNITLEGYSMFPCPKDIIHSSLRSSDVSERISMFIVLVFPFPRDMGINITRPRFCFFSLNSACRMDNRGLIYLPLLLSGSKAKTAGKLCQWGILSHLKDRGESMFFSILRSKMSFHNRPVAK